MNIIHVDPKIEDSWKEHLKEEFSKPYFGEIKNHLLTEKSKGTIIFPAGKMIFNAYNKTPFNKVKVVILGQDPYHGRGQAHGLSFSVQDGVVKPPSLVNIFKELETDLGITPPKNGNLEKWTERGVFLLNSILTVQMNQPGSHSRIGWEYFTDATIKALSEKRNGLVFLLWGKFAQQKKMLINSSKHQILTSAHPSPYSANTGFFGCKHFSQANNYLKEKGLNEIDWRL